MNLRRVSVVLCAVNILVSPLYFVFLYSAPELPTFDLERTSVGAGLLIALLVLIPKVSFNVKLGLFAGALFGMALTQSEEGEIFSALIPLLTIGYLLSSSFYSQYESTMLKLYTCVAFALFWLLTFTDLCLATLLLVYSLSGIDVPTELIKVAFGYAFDLKAVLLGNLILLPSVLSVIVMRLYKKHLTRRLSNDALCAPLS